MEFSVFLADVRPSSGSKKLSLEAAQTYSGYEEAGVHHMEENPTRLCMPSHWTGETDSPEVELSKRDRSNAPTPYCLFGGGWKLLWDHSAFIAFQSYSDLARLEYEISRVPYHKYFLRTIGECNFYWSHQLQKEKDHTSSVRYPKTKTTMTMDRDPQFTSNERSLCSSERLW